MTATDGIIVFVFCVLSFAIGYTIGAIRVARRVNVKLDEIKSSMQNVVQHSQQLQSIYAKLSNDVGVASERDHAHD